MERTVGKKSSNEDAWGIIADPYVSENNEFPNGFLWCGAMCAIQSEGGCIEGGRGLSVADVVPVGEKRLEIAKGLLANFDGKIGSCFPSRTAVDFYGHYKQDIAMMASAGLNAYKLSISWSRIFPEGTEERANEEGLRFYGKVIDELLEHGIEPILETVHWDMPLFLARECGGWKDRRVIEAYLRLVETLVVSFGNKVRYWLTIHETDCIHMYPFLVAGLVKNSDETWNQDLLDASHHMFVASALAAKLIRQRFPEAKVGAMIGLTYKYPYSCDPRDQLLAVRERMSNWLYSDVLVRGYYPSYALKEFERRNLRIPFESGDEQLLKDNTIDYMMFSYYNSLVIRHDSDDTVSNPYLGNKADPLGLRTVFNIMYDRYQIPILLGELAYKSKDKLEQDGSVHDSDRIVFLREHLKAIKDAICEDGIEIIGCMFWETVDNLSVSKGIMSERYGLIYADVNDDGSGTFDRYMKDSSMFIRGTIKNRGRDL